MNERDAAFFWNEVGKGRVDHTTHDLHEWRDSIERGGLAEQRAREADDDRQPLSSESRLSVAERWLAEDRAELKAEPAMEITQDHDHSQDQERVRW